MTIHYIHGVKVRGLLEEFIDVLEDTGGRFWFN